MAIKQISDEEREVKNGIPFTIVYIVIAILIVINGVSIILARHAPEDIPLSLVFIIFGGFLCWFKTRKLLRQLKWLKENKNLHS